MKFFYNCLTFFFLFLAFGHNHSVYGHSVQVGYCVSCTGELTLYVEHWHSTEDPNSTTMTIDLNINGVNSTVVGTPIANIQNVAFGDLPGCVNPITIFGSCPGDANTYNDWAVFKFPNLPCGVPIIIKVQSGSTAFTTDGCGMYPASSPVINVPCNINPPPVAAQNDTVCGSGSKNITLTGFSGAIQWQSAPAAGGPWTNIPGANATPLATGTVTASTFYRALETGACESNVVGIIVNQAPVSNAGSDIISCPTSNSGQIGTSNTSGYTYLWSPSGGLSSATISNPAVLLTTSGTYTYTVTTSAYGCSKTDSVVVTVNPLPTATLSGTTTVCENASSPLITFTGASTTAPYTFTYTINGAAQPTITTISGNSISIPAPTNAAGTFIYALVSVKDASPQACAQAQNGNATVTVNPLPTATIAGTTAVCKNDNAPSITFTGASATPPYTFTYSINSGPNQTISATGGVSVNLTVPTNSASVYTYSLINIMESSISTCSQTQNGGATVTVNPLPTATITGTTTVCKNATAPGVTFTGASATAPYTFTYTVNGVTQPTVASIGNSVTVSVPTAVAGTFVYALVSVMDASSTTCSQAQTGSATVIVNPLPTATIAGSTAACRNTTPPNITFTGASSAAPYTFTYTINGGPNQTVTTTGGNSVNVPAPTGTVGTFLYELVSVHDGSVTACAQLQSGSATVVIDPLPVADFDFTDQCLHQPIIFNDLSTVASGTNVSFLWDFGDGSPLNNAQNPVYIYASAGPHTVTLVPTTNNGCKDTLTKTTVVHPNPFAQFSTANVCDGSAVGFNDLTTIPSTDTLKYWRWNFGDSSAFNLYQTVSGGHLYGSPGSYTVQLRVVSTFGCSDSVTSVVVVNPNPDVAFSTNDTAGCELWCINLTDLSSISTGINVTSLWNFGDGETALESFHCYSNDAVYAPLYFNIGLTVTSDSGCVSNLSKTNYIAVYPNPVASFVAQPEVETIMNPVILLRDASIGTDFWAWNFGDGSAIYAISLDSSSIIVPPPHTYQDTGTYTIMLIASTQYSCADTAYQRIFIGPDFALYIPNAFSPNNDGINDTFFPKGIFITEFEMMIFDRWGNLIFFSDDFNKHWDGKVNYGAEIAQPDVYVYAMKGTDTFRKKHNYKGIVTLVR